MANVDRAYNQVRQELAEVGLLADGVYLDAVELCISDEKSEGERGYVFERVGHYAELGYRPGVIYLPRDLPHQPYKPGLTILDTIRHEYAHAWYYLDSSFFREEWFSRSFGANYSNCSTAPYDSWRRQLLKDPEYIACKKLQKTEAGRVKFFYGCMMRQFITEYATTNASEDFAETFMFYLKYRRSLERFVSRPAVYAKLKTVERIVSQAARRLRSRYTRPLRVRIGA